MFGPSHRAQMIASIRYWETEGDEPRRDRDFAIGVETLARYYVFDRGRWVEG